METIELPDGRVIEDWLMVRGYFFMEKDTLLV